VRTVKGMALPLQCEPTHCTYKQVCKIFKRYFATTIWHTVELLVDALRYKPGGSRFRFPLVWLVFFVFPFVLQCNFVVLKSFKKVDILTSFSWLNVHNRINNSPQLNPMLLLQFVGPAESHQAYCSLSRLIVLAPILFHPFISRCTPSQNGVRDLY
jgi:hypothetical protein